MRAADLIVEYFKAQGLKRIYCVPGESYLTLLDALYNSSIETIVCRHESGAGFMAVNEAKITGKPAVFMVSRGPGATNGSIAVHVADQDATPLVVIVGQVPRNERSRGAFQEVDYSHFLGCMAKGVFEVSDANQMAEILARAFRLAAEGIAGPVILSVPEDVFEEECNSSVPEPFIVPIPQHSPDHVEAVQEMIDASERPVVMAGGILRSKRGGEALARFAEAQRIPVAATWKNQDVFDNRSSLYAGHLGFGAPAKLRETLSGSDLIIAVGTRLGDVASLNYSFPEAPQPKQKLIHIYPASGCIGKVFRTDLGIIADPIPLLESLSSRPRVVTSSREAWISSVNSFVRSFMTFRSTEPNDGVDFGTVVAALAELAPPDSVITTDAGNMSTWVHRHWPMTPRNLLLGAIAGAMGYGVPAAVASALQMPGRMTIAFVGDGGVLMTGQELATAQQYNAKIKIVISDNGTYGTIRTHQERHFPNRISGTVLKNPDFTTWARSFGAHTVTISKGDDIKAKVKEALDHEGTSIMHVKSSQEALSAYTTLSALKR